jgi:HKD family nuclease
MQLSRNSRIEAKVFPLGVEFHPKVLIVNAADRALRLEGRRSFAIVGSANLSEGGLLRNIEYSLYTDRDDHIRALGAVVPRVL